MPVHAISELPPVGMDVRRSPRSEMPKDQFQLLLLLRIRACALNKGFLAADDSLKLAITSRSGHAVWWAWVKWAAAQLPAEG